MKKSEKKSMFAGEIKKRTAKNAEMPSEIGEKCVIYKKHKMKEKHQIMKEKQNNE